jgi:purine-binding chemotaxis protein CheW
MDVQLVGFRVGSEYYAVNILSVVQIIFPKKPVKVAQAPPFVEGIIRLRSLVIPVVDLRRRFDVEVSERRTNRIIVMRLACTPDSVGTGSKPASGEDAQHLGLVVDEATQVIRTQTENFLRAPRVLTQGEAAYSGEVYQDAAQRLYMVLDIGRILTPVEKRQLESELSTSPMPAEGS